MIKAKEEVAKLLSRLPDDCTLEDIQYHIYVMQKIQKGLEDFENGNTYTHEEVIKLMEKKIQNI